MIYKIHKFYKLHNSQGSYSFCSSLGCYNDSSICPINGDGLSAARAKRPAACAALLRDVP